MANKQGGESKGNDEELRKKLLAACSEIGSYRAVVDGAITELVKRAKENERLLKALQTQSLKLEWLELTKALWIDTPLGDGASHHRPATEEEAIERLTTLVQSKALGQQQLLPFRVQAQPQPQPQPQPQQPAQQPQPQQSQQNSVSVFENLNGKTTVLDAMNQYAREKGFNGIHDPSMRFQEDDYMRLNAKSKEAIDQKLKGGELERIIATPSPNNPLVQVYKHGKSSLTQTKDIDGMLSFMPDRSFTGVVRVQRMGPDGKLDPKQEDMLEYKNGRLVAVCLAAEGKPRIKDLGVLLEQARKEQSRVPGMVNAKVELVWEEPFTAPPTPRKPEPLRSKGGAHEI